MFTPKTEKIEKIAIDNQKTIEKLEKIFEQKTRIYIDYANVRPWSEKLGWHIDLKRLKQLLDSFDTIEAINFYNGYLAADERSEKEKTEAENNKYILRTKPVKILKIPIKASAVPSDSTKLLKQFIRTALLEKYDVAMIELLNGKFRELNRNGIYVIEDKKCNFDVEIGIDMLLDYEHNNVGTFVLWSGDSDFADPIQRLLAAGKQVFLFATAKRIASELNDLNEIKENGLHIFDIADLKEFICWSRESLYRRTKDPVAEAF